MMMTADGNWKIDGEQIKYNGAEFKQMKVLCILSIRCQCEI